MARVTAATVNAELKRLGFEERLVRGRGYYYFCEGNAHMWPSCSIHVYQANSMTLEQWIEEYHSLKNADLVSTLYD